MGKPLMLDDVRMVGPDRDNGEAFDPAATWEQARGFAEGGYAPATVADVLAELDAEDSAALACWLINVPGEHTTALYHAWANY
jgi:hypothetical protein